LNNEIREGISRLKIEMGKERGNIEIEKWNQEMKRGLLRLESDIRKWEEEYKDWRVKRGNEKKNIKIEKW
jgi:hypothetical protein